MIASLNALRSRQRASRVVAGGVAMLVAAGSAAADPLTLTSEVPASGFNGGTVAAIPLTSNGDNQSPVTPWDYTGQNYVDLESIQSVSVSFIINSASTDQGGENFDEWTLGLDGIDTGLKLNGIPFSGPGGASVNATIEGAIQNADQIIAALKADGKLIGTILDSQPGDDFISLGSFGNPIGPTELVINGDSGVEPNPDPDPDPSPVIPLPAAVFVFPLGAVVAGLCAKRMRRQRDA